LVTGEPIHIRPATIGDAEAVGDLASQLATSFPFSRASFDAGYAALLSSDSASLLVADYGDGVVGYLLGFTHVTFYANGPVAWVEEILVRDDARGRGTGRALMQAFEEWATQRDCVLVALATRRAVPFYRALEYEESAVYLRKILPAQAAR
jgi:GNAT superfamily N-acetyltransferase